MAKFGSIFKDTEVKKTEQHPRRETKWLHYTKLVDNKAQYCNERDKEEIIALAGLIDADKGVLQNLLVRKIDTDQYEIIAGHKRRRACRYLVEEEGKEEYAFVPCMVESLSDIRAEFQLYSSNSFHPKNEYEIMHELERMKYLLENYPEEFPNLQTGRMVERLAKQLNMKKTTVGDYLTIANNLGEKGMEAFQAGELKKSAALELSSLGEKEQETLLESGITSHRAIKEYKEAKIGKVTERSSLTDSTTKIKTMSGEISAEDNIPGQARIIDTEMRIEEPVVEAEPEKTAEQPVEQDDSIEYKAESQNESAELDEEKETLFCKIGKMTIDEFTEFISSIVSEDWLNAIICGHVCKNKKKCTLDKCIYENKDVRAIKEILLLSADEYQDIQQKIRG